MCESGWMRKGIEVRLGPGDRERLEAVIGSGNSSQKHVWRARSVVLSAAGGGTVAIPRETRKGKPTTLRWHAPLLGEGGEALMDESPPPPAHAPPSAPR